MISDQNPYSARMYGQSGAFKDLFNKINDRDMNTLGDVLQFKKNYAAMRQEKIDAAVAMVKREIPQMIAERGKLALERDAESKSKSEELNQTISRLESELTHPNLKHNLLAKFFYKIKRWLLNGKLKYFKSNFQSILDNTTAKYDKRLATMESQIKYTESNIETVARGNISNELHRIDEINDTLEREKYLLFGAIGEARVIDELKKLPDTYYVINDFRRHFQPPLYNRAENDRVFSIQVDHLVVGPTGVFVVEAKYWSDKSISSEMLFSPVKQVRRLGFALFVILNDAIKSGSIPAMVNNWGKRKISPRQIVASVNSVPHEEFQYVRVVEAGKLNSYIT